MPPTPNDAKLQALRASHTLHPQPDKVRHPLFAAGGFFDAHDLLQVKYEAVRSQQTERQPLSQVARDFGLSRPTLYQAKKVLGAQGLEGLLPRKAGRKTAHKFTPEVLDFLQGLRAEQPTLSALELARRLQQRFRCQVHPRSIERALAGHREKKGRRNPPPKTV